MAGKRTCRSCPCPKPPQLDNVERRRDRKKKRRAQVDEDQERAIQMHRVARYRADRDISRLDYEPTPQTEEERAFRPMPWPID